MKSIVIAGSILALFGMQPALAESPCKGLDVSACSANAACGWTDGYTRKDGREVQGYCRAKPKPRPDKAASTATPKG